MIAAARELGLHVPDDLSVIGYDDIEAADYVGLTTVRQQLFESGRRGAGILLGGIGSRCEAANNPVETPSWCSPRPPRPNGGGGVGGAHPTRTREGKGKEEKSKS